MNICGTIHKKMSDLAFSLDPEDIKTGNKIPMNYRIEVKFNRMMEHDTRSMHTKFHCNIAIILCNIDGQHSEWHFSCSAEGYTYVSLNGSELLPDFGYLFDILV